MRIALIGYGKMGHMIETVARERGHEIVAVIDVDNYNDMDTAAFASADVAIEFTSPSAAFDNCRRAMERGVKVVSGSTGWTDRLPELKKMCDAGHGTLLQSSNFSIGMNLFMAANRYLARLMRNQPQYTPSMEEIHHIHKLDHPSGTALTLADELMDARSGFTGWMETDGSGNVPEGVLPITARREGEVPGIHTIRWDSQEDTITLTHSAKSRRGFALGAVVAAEWLNGHKGFHTMGDLFDF